MQNTFAQKYGANNLEEDSLAQYPAAISMSMRAFPICLVFVELATCRIQRINKG